MKIIYDDLAEFVEIRFRCEDTRDGGQCEFCPFYARCQMDDDENLHVMCCEIVSMQQPMQQGLLDEIATTTTQ